MSWPKTSRQSRGYGAAWDRLRLRILRRDSYLCRCPRCEKSGVVRAATEVHHVIPKAKGGTDDPSNLVSINSECHRIISEADRGRRRRPAFDARGNPID